jgi:hypothetical protein
MFSLLDVGFGLILLRETTFAFTLCVHLKTILTHSNLCVTQTELTESLKRCAKRGIATQTGGLTNSS